MSESGVERLARLVRERRVDLPHVDLQPVSAYEVLTRQKVEDLEQEMKALRKRIDALLFMVLSAIAAEVVSRVFGG